MDQFLRKNLWVINLLSLAALAFFLATGAGSFISLLFVTEPTDDGSGPVARVPRKSKVKTRRFSKRDSQDICRNNVFNYKLRPCADDMTMDYGDEGGEEEEDGKGVPPYCSGSGSLIATMASTDETWSFAMIKSEGKTMPYRSGDEVPGLGKISKVGWRLVLVDSSSGPNCLLDLYPPSKSNEPKARPSHSTASSAPKRKSSRGRLSPELQKQIDEGIVETSATERSIDRGLVDSLIENSSALMSQARILPYERDGVTEGFKLYGIRRNSLLGKLGLRNGDIVHSIGGVEMSSPDQALMAYTKLRSASHIAVDFTRRGRRQSMDYNIR